MANQFERIGQQASEADVLIGIDDAERMRYIAQNVILSPESSKHVSDSLIAASLVVSNQIYMPALAGDHGAAASLYAYVEDESFGDIGWRTLLKYHSYRMDDGLMGFESAYEVNVLDNEVVLAKRALYRLRDHRDVSTNGREINIVVDERRTMAETALQSCHVDRLESRMTRLVHRAERS